MEPLIATTTWASYTPSTNELLQNRSSMFSVQIVMGALSEDSDPGLGALADYQGTVLTPLTSMVVLSGETVHYRAIGVSGIAIGRNPQ